MIETILIALLAVYCLQVLVILGANSFPRKAARRKTGNALVSIVVAARNEEQHIKRCLESLFSQRFVRAEVILVDDRSTDRTAAVAAEVKKPGNDFRLLRVEKNESGLTGKQNALHAGIGAARGDILLLTDADCVADPLWASRMVEALEGNGNDLVFGVTRLWPVRTFWQKFESLELNLLFTVALGLSRLGIPGSCMGNNLAFRKSAYLQVGGYFAMGYQPTEDFALLHLFKKQGKKISAEYEEISMYTRPSESVAQWFRQRVRWLCGSLTPAGWLFWALLPLVVVNCGVPALLLAGKGSLLLLYLFTMKVALDALLIVWRAGTRHFSVIPVMLLYYGIGAPMYLVLYLFSRKTVWKSDTVRLRSGTSV